MHSANRWTCICGARNTGYNATCHRCAWERDYGMVPVSFQPEPVAPLSYGGTPWLSLLRLLQFAHLAVSRFNRLYRALRPR